MAKFSWGSAAAFSLVLLVVVIISLRNVGEPSLLLFNPRESLVDEGVAMVLLCGDQPDRETVNMRGRAIVRLGLGNGPWTYRQREGDCVVYYHHPLDFGD